MMSALSFAPPVLAAFGLAIMLTPAVAAAARRWGMVARPKADRWHSKPTALMGGVAIFASVVAVELACVPLSRQSLVVIGASALMFLVGLVDDLLDLKPYQKLAGQVLAAALVIASGLTLPWTPFPPVNALVTLFWVVGITNAVNLLDNMDGLAAGVASIACATLGAHFWAGGQLDSVLMLVVFGAALVGFLVYNSNPASVFMGDCGSLFIGFFLASSALLSPTGGRSRALLPVLAVPVLTLFIPIFDTVFVMALRKLAGRPVSRGGRDHTSHRLVALGLSERHAVLLLYGLAGASGLLAVLVSNLPLDVSLAAVTGFTVLLTMLGFHLARVKVYDEEEVRAARERPLVAFLVDLSYKRRVLEVSLDVLLMGLSYYTAHALVYGPVTGSGPWDRFLVVAAALVAVKLATFLVLGVYRGLWRYVSLDSLVLYARAVFAATVAGALTLLAFQRFGGTRVSRVVVVLDGLLLLALVAGSRLSFRLVRRLIPPPPVARGRRVLIFGAGDAGELLARELFNNPALGLRPVGFADDDPFKQGGVIHGLPVFRGNGSLVDVCREQGVDEVVISSSRVPGERVESLARDCEAAGLSLRRLSLRIERIDVRPAAAALEPSPSFEPQSALAAG